MNISKRPQTTLPSFQDSRLQLVGQYSSLIVEELTSNYSEMLNNLSGKKQKTRDTYIENVATFLAFIQANGIDSDTFRNFRTTIEGAQRSVSTKNAWLAAASALLKEAHRKGILPVDITVNVEHFKIARGHKRDGLNQQEVEKVFSFISSIQNEGKRLKIKAIASLLTFEGLRQAEVLGLKVSDVNLSDNCLMIQRKGDDEKSMFIITSRSAKALSEFISHANPANYLFEGRNGEAMTLRAVRKVFTDPVRGIFHVCGIKGKTVHGFRHYNITKTLEAFNGDLSKTRNRSGHKSFDMLIVYNDSRTTRQDVEKLDSFFA